MSRRLAQELDDRRVGPDNFPERRSEYQQLNGMKEDLSEIKRLQLKQSRQIEDLHNAVVGTPDEQVVGILPRLRDVEKFVHNYRYIILATSASLTISIVTKLLGAW